ncbi:hypothetical protein IC582_001384 [Cucumis melo]
MWTFETTNVFHVFIVIFYFQYDNLIPCPKYVWMKEEDTLVECLVELVSTSGWKLRNSMFRQGYQRDLWASVQWIQMER